jgi:hypothetical protein
MAAGALGGCSVAIMAVTTRFTELVGCRVPIQQAPMGSVSTPITLPKGHGLPPGAAATGHINAMAMYAGESAAAITAIEPAAHVIQSWCAAAEESR